MYFRNLQLYRLTASWSYTKDKLAESLAIATLKPCGAMDRQSQGWIPPRGDAEELVVSVGQNVLIALGIEQKLLPVSVVRQYAQERCTEIEESQGFKPGRAQAREIFDAVEAELLPRSHVVRSRINVWLDLENLVMCVDASSASKGDAVIEQLKATLGELPLTFIKTEMSPGSAMTSWLLTEAPYAFSIDQDCILRALGDAGGKIQYSQHTLDEDVKEHIANGKVVGRLALTWHDRISFALTEQMQIKKLAFLDVLKEQAEQIGEGDDHYLTDFTIMAGELSKMLLDLTNALGGEVVDTVDAGEILNGNGDETDPLYQTAVDIVTKSKRPSISLVQRHLRIGYNHAARLIEQMEKDGIVTPMDASGVRGMAA